MYIEAVPNRNSPPAILLRESFCEGGKVKKRTLLNLSNWPPAQKAFDLLGIDPVRPSKAAAPQPTIKLDQLVASSSPRKFRLEPVAGPQWRGKPSFVPRHLVGRRAPLCDLRCRR